MTPEQAEQLAQATLAALYEWDLAAPVSEAERLAADRERVTSDLRSYMNALTLADHYGSTGVRMLAADALNGLRRTARLYGVEGLAALDDLARIAPPSPHRATPEHVCYRCEPPTTPARTPAPSPEVPA